MPNGARYDGPDNERMIVSAVETYSFLSAPDEYCPNSNKAEARIAPADASRFAFGISGALKSQ